MIKHINCVYKNLTIVNNFLLDVIDKAGDFQMFPLAVHSIANPAIPESQINKLGLAPPPVSCPDCWGCSALCPGRRMEGGISRHRK